MSWFIALQGPLLKVTKAILTMVSNPAMKLILKVILKAPKVKLSAVSLIMMHHMRMSLMNFTAYKKTKEEVGSVKQFASYIDI